ncbi:M20/M25/M40 family metallo-hydrolase [Microbacterium immunditiarum]|uniref:Zn-dependent M28 family amino/carboxypeptidase n=1 Tax=Microbacterium immunditiarum TaxID=337480 RepID=A0A7Y9GQZ7_9MICO|nr:M20/M25/M40 family metallo-hydrolase [Microbacterium immunditiarum]NYE20922.1 Zn-dependent M28 family amino/carboxypeptidase [Microbacterium immunditiarum]
MLKRKTRTAAFVAVGAVAASLAIASPALAVPNNNSAKKLTKAVTLEGVMDHLQAFQAIADEHGDRAAGRPGYEASVDYVVDQLTDAGYSPVVQDFEFPYFDENNALVRVSPNPRTFIDGTDFLRNRFDSGSPEGTATAPLVPVGIVLVDEDDPPNSNSSGCEAADFAGFPVGSIALMQRGTCGFAVKALNAEAAGAAGAIIMNEGQSIPTDREGLLNMIGDATGLTIPTVFVTADAGEDLNSTPGAIVTVTVDYDEEIRTAWNVFAETQAGNDDNVVMAGAHLDGVQDGAGINDNGSGSAALLETAIQMQKVKPNNTVRFAWWGAEEEGLLGSEYYVENLSEQERGDIALYLNFDMIGSPNYMFGIYDGDNSGGTAAPGFIPEGSAQIEDVFEAYYDSVGEPYQDTDFSGRSDYGPFIAVDIPAGGLFTGAEDKKTVDEAALYGGVIDAAYDPCYHQPCDNLTGAGQDVTLYDLLRAEYDLEGNVNLHALDVNSDAVATAVITFAFDTSTVNGVSAPGKSHGAGKSMDAFKNRFAG